MKTKKFNSENAALDAAIAFQSQSTNSDIDTGTYKGQYDCFVVVSLSTGDVLFTAYYL